MNLGMPEPRREKSREQIESELFAAVKDARAAWDLEPNARTRERFMRTLMDFNNLILYGKKPEDA